MEEAMQAFVFFWLAGLLLVLGTLLAFFSKQKAPRQVGFAAALVGLLSLLATPWTLSFSPSSAFGHLLGSVLGPSVLLAVGFYLIAFSGHVPVGRLSKQDRMLGVAMVVAGVVWFEAMHWWTLTPTYPSDVNPYWLIFWPTMLLFGFATATGAYAFVGVAGDNRLREQRLMMVVSVFFLALMILGATSDGPHVDRERFITELLLAAADLFGVLVGAAAAVLLFFLVVLLYERQQPEPATLPPPTSEQLDQASAVVAHHLGGGEEE
jgi:hypothetical protein